ncbi:MULTISPECIES: patatin-like phospholipase family protein [Thalassolituus]|jgi:predicted patatin/cPLA2 family phospholipase|uniref:patatin-like phospholipase family protein n=1 Tax=Thalassolituus TaxID=187492 RepID=UPI000ED6C16A|nr:MULTISPECIES: patatin family protein [Thalassolituus]MEC9409546.1 patatin family protein [Pseudomonadota bacterium]MEE3159612.1 patatin family protein [Pseudomonadota bacterium]HCG78276.1 patatin family protein [Oceanospirillales bacterium]|tara:strand:- start:45919 stop:46845 length:927 start_codon:yes stop_codon:yes gene_type:complete
MASDDTVNNSVKDSVASNDTAGGSKKAIVVEGGAMRGIFASGVIDHFLERGYHEFDFAIGVSAGATNLTGYLSRQPGRARTAIMEYARQKEFFSPVRFVRGGHMTDVHWLWHYTHQQLPLAEFVGDMELYATATHVDTGQAHYLPVTGNTVHDAMVATCAIPYFYRSPVTVNSERYVDGGVADSIPVRQAWNMGADDITVVLSQPLGFRKKDSQSHWLLEKMFAGEAGLMNAMKFRTAQYNESLDFIASPPEGCRVRVIAPPPEFAVSRLCMNEKKLVDGYDMGVAAASTYLEELYAPQPDLRIVSVA